MDETRVNSIMGDMSGMMSNANSLGETMSSMRSNASSSTVPTKPQDLSASGVSKIDRSFGQSEITLKRPSKLVVITKWAVTFICGALFLGCLVSAKLSIIGLAAKLNSTGNCYDSGESDGERAVECSTSFIHIMLVLLIPNVITFLRFTWNSIGRKDRKWPTGNRLLYCIIISLLESVGLCTFAFRVLKMEESAVIVLLMDGVYIGHAILNIFSSETLFHRITKSKIWFILSSIFLLGGFGLTVYVALTKTSNTGDKVAIFISILFLSLAWLPWLRRKLITVTEETKYDLTFAEESTATFENNSQRVEMYVNTEEQYTDKLMIISSFAKIIFTFLFSFIVHDAVGGNLENTHKQWANGWNFVLNFETVLGQQSYFFLINITTSAFGYFVGLYALRTQMGKGAFALPLLFSTPVTFGLLYIKDLCPGLFFGKTQFPYDDDICKFDPDTVPYLVFAVIALFVGQILAAGFHVFCSQTIVLQKELKLFWLPIYNGIMPDQCMLLDRRTQFMDKQQQKPEERNKRTKVYICTTMFRESREEMKQLLESIAHINAAKQIGNRHFESHIIFDGGIKGNDVTKMAYQLISLVPEVLKTSDVDTCTKAEFPYGVRLSFKLPASRGEDSGHPMTFVIHLKDNRKVKNKKRWSQIMYMSYVLDFLVKEDSSADDDTAFILTTDADVKFTPDSVEALLDLMTRDSSVGAVCARTYPLGFGPLYWYQKFEYAIGHWFQKAAEHVLGSVLCAPGCFSVYRVKALRDIIPTYASGVQQGMEFLTKDMGEDRWLCTLMVQSGWRIDYCAASSNYTNCPTDFDEFYTQRRRWIGSTVANLYLLLMESSVVKKLNQGISIWFLIYQALLLISTVLGPSTVTLVISGGLAFAWNLDVIATVVVQFVLIVGFGLICIKCSQKVQLTAAKILTFLYALVMMAVVVGTAEQLVESLANISNEAYMDGNVTVDPTLSPDAISASFPVSMTTIYFGILVGLFLVTGLLHISEFSCLFQGLWFLLCLPSGYILLIIYSVVNITDRSWGTREEKVQNSIKKDLTWYEQLGAILRQIFFCCGEKIEKPRDSSIDHEDAENPGGRKRQLSDVSEEDFNLSASYNFTESFSKERTEQIDEEQSEAPYQYGDENSVITTEVWLESIDVEMKTKYLKAFIRNGYDDTTFIAGMTEKDLERLPIGTKSHRIRIKRSIDDLPEYYMEPTVPTNAEEWLKTIGLEKYKSNFKKSQIKSTGDLEQLKGYKREDIIEVLKITKPAHIRRLLEAIKYLRTPTKEEVLYVEIKKKLDNAILHDIKKINRTEFDFWNLLVKSHLEPSLEGFSMIGELKCKLVELRNNWLMILLAINSLWLVLISTLASKINLLILGSNPVGLVFLFIFGVLLIIQFICMIFHRLTTLAHFLARAPYKFDHDYKTSWSYRTDEDIQAEADAKAAERQCREKYKNQGLSRRVKTRTGTETTPLIEKSETSYA